MHKVNRTSFFTQLKTKLPEAKDDRFTLCCKVQIKEFSFIWRHRP